MITPEITALYSPRKEQTRKMVDAVYGNNPQQDLVDLLANWNHCGSRDCPEQSGMYHVADTLHSTSDDASMSLQVAHVIAELLPNLPAKIGDLLKSPTEYDRRWRNSKITRASANVLALASSVVEPDLLANPLGNLVDTGKILRLKRSREIDAKELGYISNIERDPLRLLRDAVILNQADRRFESLWLGMLADGKSTKLPITAHETNRDYLKWARQYAVRGILKIPGVLSNDVDPVLIEAGKVLSQVEGYKNPTDKKDMYYHDRSRRDRDFRQILLWPMLQEQSFDDSVLTKMLSKKDDLGWEKWAVESLEYFLTPGSLNLSYLEQIYRKAALSQHLAKQMAVLEPNGLRGTNLSSNYITMNLIERELDQTIGQEMDDLYLEMAVIDEAYRRSIEEKWFPDNIAINTKQN